MDRHGKRYTPSERKLLNDWASKPNTKQDLYDNADTIAEDLERHVPAVCKQIEDIKKQTDNEKKWYWAQKK